MEKLLKRWAELEPGRCEVRETQSPYSGNQDFLVLVDGEISDYLFNAIPYNQVQSQIMAACMEAIEARGWVWRVRGHGTYAVAWVWFNIQSSDHEQTADTPAEALLRAYLAALEAQTTEDADAS